MQRGGGPIPLSMGKDRSRRSASAAGDGREQGYLVGTLDLGLGARQPPIDGVAAGAGALLRNETQALGTQTGAAGDRLGTRADVLARAANVETGGHAGRNPDLIAIPLATLLDLDRIGPGGSGCPGEDAGGVPGSSGWPIDPAGMRWATLRRAGPKATSAQRMAYPSMALLSQAGTSQAGFQGHATASSLDCAPTRSSDTPLLAR